jgi:hypothetical protein
VFKIRIIPTQDISQHYLDEIIRIKSSAWPYAYEDQLKWINENLKYNDLHSLLFYKEKVIAYLNFISIKLNINDESYDALGIGNVCTLEKGKGLGNILIQLNNKYLTDNNKIGLLFCKQSLVSFYKRNGWSIVEKSCLNLHFNNKNIETMILNYSKPVNRLTYIGKAF